jgi:hypothetical protein
MLEILRKSYRIVVSSIKVISHGFLDDAKAWSDTRKKHASFVANEFAD